MEPQSNHLQLSSEQQAQQQQYRHLDDFTRRFMLESIHSYIVGHGNVAFPKEISISVSYEDGHCEQFGSTFPKISSLPDTAGGAASIGHQLEGTSYTMDIDHERAYNAVPQDPKEHGHGHKVSLTGFEEESSRPMERNTNPDIPQEIWDCMTEKERLVYVFGDSDDGGDESEDSESKTFSRPTRRLPRRPIQSSK